MLTLHAFVFLVGRRGGKRCSNGRHSAAEPEPRRPASSVPQNLAGKPIQGRTSRVGHHGAGRHGQERCLFSGHGRTLAAAARRALLQLLVSRANARDSVPGRSMWKCAPLNASALVCGDFMRLQVIVAEHGAAFSAAFMLMKPLSRRSCKADCSAARLSVDAKSSRLDVHRPRVDVACPSLRR